MAQFAIPDNQVKEMQEKGLEMLLYFDQFCTEQKLTYFLCGGCCIGTVRTGGFIPWDDDVDIFMPRTDYEKLKQLWVDTERYAIQYPTKAFLTQNQFLTIHDNNTTFIKSYQKDLDINHGVALDVLPLDGCPTGWRRKVQKALALTYSLFVVEKAPENHGKLVYALGMLALNLVPFHTARYHIWRFCEKQMSKYPIDQCNYITELCSGPHYMQKEYPKDAFDHAIRRSFEGHQLPIPVGYDTYLSMAFGDYMQIPPKDQQICHHEYEYLDMHNSYKKYRGVWYLVQKER